MLFRSGTGNPVDLWHLQKLFLQQLIFKTAHMKLSMKGRIVGQDGRLTSLKTLETLNTELISEHLERIAIIMLLCAMQKNNAMERKIKKSTSIQNSHMLALD